MKSKILLILVGILLVATAVHGQALCGNGIVETGESCDDGNTVSGDGCSATCVFESTATTLTKSCSPSPNSIDTDFSGTVFVTYVIVNPSPTDDVAGLFEINTHDSDFTPNTGSITTTLTNAIITPGVPTGTQFSVVVAPDPEITPPVLVGASTTAAVYTVPYTVNTPSAGAKTFGFDTVTASDDEANNLEISSADCTLTVNSVTNPVDQGGGGGTRFYRVNTPQHQSALQNQAFANCGAPADNVICYALDVKTAEEYCGRAEEEIQRKIKTPYLARLPIQCVRQSKKTLAPVSPISKALVGDATTTYVAPKKEQKQEPKEKPKKIPQVPEPTVQQVEAATNTKDSLPWALGSALAMILIAGAFGAIATFRKFEAPQTNFEELPQMMPQKGLSADDINLEDLPDMIDDEGHSSPFLHLPPVMRDAPMRTRRTQEEEKHEFYESVFNKKR